MSTNTAPHFSPREIARVLFRHSRKIAIVFGSVLVLALLAVMLYPRSYSSEAKLMIRMGRETVGLDPTATTGETIMLQKTQEDEVNSAVAILNGRGVLERAIEKVGAERILSDPRKVETAEAAEAEASSGGLSSWIGSTLETLGLSDPGTEMDRAVRKLEKKLHVYAPKQSVVITLSYTAASPELAHDVVQAVSEAFLEEHSRLSQTDGSLQFFAAQVEKLHDDLTNAQGRLRDLKNDYQTTRRVSQPSIIEQAKDAMRQKVYDLKILENDLMSRYTDAYPPLREVRLQRQLAEQMLLNESDVTLKMAEPAEDAPKSRQAKVRPASYEVVANESKSRAQLDAELRSLNERELELAQMELEVRLLEGKYEMHVEKLEQARVNDALGRERITNVKVAQPASLVHKPVSPNKLLLLAGALVIGVIASLGTAFAAEGLDPTLRTSEQVEAQLGLPVLASLPARKPRGTSAEGSTEESAHAINTPAACAARKKNYRGLLATLRTNDDGATHGKVVGIVGVGASKLRSQLAGDLAIEAAGSGAADPVLLIDADAQGRRISKRFQLNGSAGWQELLAGTSELAKCVKRPESANLGVVGPGNASQNTAGGEANAVANINAIKSDYGLVIVDLPSADELDSAHVAEHWIDEAVVVIEAERTRTQAAKRMIDTLSLSGVHVVGVVLANRREHIPRWLNQRL